MFALVMERGGDLRAVLHLDGTDLLESLLGQVTALTEQVHPTALEVLKLKEVYLGRKKKDKCK